MKTQIARESRSTMHPGQRTEHTQRCIKHHSCTIMAVQHLVPSVDMAVQSCQYSSHGVMIVDHSSGSGTSKTAISWTCITANEGCYPSTTTHAISPTSTRSFVPKRHSRVKAGDPKMWGKRKRMLPLSPTI